MCPTCVGDTLQLSTNKRKMSAPTALVSAPMRLSEIVARWRRRVAKHPFAFLFGCGLSLLAARALVKSALSHQHMLINVRKRRPRFAMDRTEGFYAFVFSESGICMAHGGDASHVGRSLAEVFSNDGTSPPNPPAALDRPSAYETSSLARVVVRSCTTEIEDPSELHERFMRTAAAGGGFCAYSWRSSQMTLRLRGAYIVAVHVGGPGGRLLGYAGVGCACSALNPPRPRPHDDHGI